MRHVAAKLLPRLLMGAQKENRVTVRQELFDHSIAALLSRFGSCGFFLFPKLKSSLKGRRFQTVEETEKNSTRDLRPIPQNTFQDAF
jgi:hypothetical protein